MAESDLEFQLRIFRIDRIAGVAETAIRFGSLAVIAVFAWLSIRSLAGQRTFADIGIRVITDLRLSEAFAYLFGVGGVAYGLGERHLRRNRTQHFTTRMAALEQRLDPNRSSSTLTSRGTTRKGD
jgi:hypothetical protein